MEEVIRKEEKKNELAAARGEVKPPTTPNKVKKIRSGRRSSRATARNQVRLLEFHQECVELRGFPPSRL